MDNIAQLSSRVDLLQQFVQKLTEHYGAEEVPNPKGHRQFINPWAFEPGSYVFIRRGDMRVSFGTSLTQSCVMSENMIGRVVSGSYPKPTGLRPPPREPRPPVR